MTARADGPSHSFMALASHAAGTAAVARTVIKAHKLGISSGPCREPWLLDHERQEVLIWLDTLPEPYVRQVGESFAFCARLLRAQHITDGPIMEWRLLTTKAESTVTAVAEQLHTDLGGSGQLNAFDPRPPAPGLLRIDMLAGLVHPQGAAALAHAATAVDVHCRRLAYGHVTGEEIEWLRSLARGERIVDLATRCRRSERALYRALSGLWARLGVSGRAQALALAAQMGWLDGDEADAGAGGHRATPR